MKKLNSMVFISLLIGVVFCNSAFASVVLTRGRGEITMGTFIVPRSIHAELPPLLNAFITPSGNIIQPGQGVQKALEAANVMAPESINVAVTGNLYLDFSVFSSLPGLFITGDVSFISAEQTSIFSFANTPLIEDLTNLTVYKEMPVDFNGDGHALFFSSQPIINGIFEADNIYIGNYSELSASAVPLPAAFWFFGSGLFGLASLRLSGLSFTKY